MVDYSPNANVHSLWSRNVPLGVLCQACGRRALVDVRTICRWGGKGDMRSMREVAKLFKCTPCNKKNAYAFVPESRDWAERWLLKRVDETPGLD